MFSFRPAIFPIRRRSGGLEEVAQLMAAAGGTRHGRCLATEQRGKQLTNVEDAASLFANDLLDLGRAVSADVAGPSPRAVQERDAICRRINDPTIGQGHRRPEYDGSSGGALALNRGFGRDQRMGAVCGYEIDD